MKWIQAWVVFVVFFFALYMLKGNQEMLQNHVHIDVYRVMQALYPVLVFQLVLEIKVRILKRCLALSSV